MASFATRHFGVVPIEDDGAYVKRELRLGDRTCERSLYVGQELAADPDRLARASALLDTLEVLDVRARAALQSRLATEPSDDALVGSYLAFHRDELDPDTLRGALGADPTGLDNAAMLARLDLVGVALHADADAFSLVLDYSLGRAITDQLLAVKHGPDGTVTDISHES